MEKERRLKLSLLEKQLQYEKSREFHILKMHFSSGISLFELKSVSTILTSVYNIPKPSRDQKRSSVLLLGWFIENWSYIEPVLPFIHLLDENKVVINGAREMIETGLITI